MTDNEHPDLQHDVQRLLGRCMLRLQQYEQLLKAMLAHQQLIGPAHQLEALQSSRVSSFETKSLGTLVKSLFETYVVTENVTRPLLDEAKLPVDTMSFGFRSNLVMSEERVAQTNASLDELVSLRNDLVHHLIERFDVRTEEGCLAASRHLTDSYARIDKRLEELREWATSMDKARGLTASFVQSGAFQNFVVNGIAPDGTVDWPAAGIVRVLREAMGSLAAGGWMLLDDAVSWIAEHHAEQVPEKYGCRSWPQVLHESRLFRLEYREDNARRKRAWFSLNLAPR